MQMGEGFRLVEGGARSVVVSWFGMSVCILWYAYDSMTG